MTTTSSNTPKHHEHQSDDNYPARLMEAHPKLGDAIGRVAEQAASKRKIKNPDQALLSAAYSGDLERLREALKAGANPSAIEETSRSIGMHGRVLGPQRSALQLALLSRSKNAYECAYVLIQSGSDYSYENRWGETSASILRNRLARARLPERNYRLFGDYLLRKILNPVRVRNWLDEASRDLFTKVKGERP